MTGTSDSAVVKVRAVDCSVLRSPLSSTMASRRHNARLRRSRSVDDLMRGTHTLPIDMRSPGATVRSKSKPFAPYHALHHLPAETRPKHLDRYHRLEINFKPGTGEGYDHTEVKSPRLPYHHLEIGTTNQQDSARPAVELQSEDDAASDGEPVYQNLLNLSVEEQGGDSADGRKNREDSELYANVSDIVVSSRTQPMMPQDPHHYLDVSDGTGSVQPSGIGEEAHRSSGDKKKEHSLLYENFEFGNKGPNVVSHVLPQTGRHELCDEEPTSADLYVNVPVVGVDRDRHQQSVCIDKTSETKVWDDKRMAFAARGGATSSGDYSYPVVRSARGLSRKGIHSQIPIDSDDEECHYYGVDVRWQDESDEMDEVSPNSHMLQTWTVSTPRDEDLSAAVSELAAALPPRGDQLTTGTSLGASSPSILSAPGSPNRSRPPSPAEALYEFNKELQWKSAHRSPTSK